MTMPNVTIPAGVGYSISAGRETTQIGPNNQNVQGMIFNLTLTNGATTSVFVPYTLMTDTAGVQALFASRVAAIAAIVSLPTS